MIKNISQIRSSLSLLLIFTVLLGGLYPAVITVFAEVFFYKKATGSLIEKNGSAIASGSLLIGQNFTDNKYFWGRLSANNYDSNNSGGTNLSPSNPKLLEKANVRIEALRKADPKNSAKIPVELITASASGLDPHISRLAAEYQIGRIAKARNITDIDLQQLITDHINMQSKLFGNPFVNVLELNIALDEIQK